MSGISELWATSLVPPCLRFHFTLLVFFSIQNCGLPWYLQRKALPVKQGKPVKSRVSCSFFGKQRPDLTLSLPTVRIIFNPEPTCSLLSELTHPYWFSVCLFYQLRGEEGWRLDLNCGFLLSVPLVLPPELWSSVIRHVRLWKGPFIVT